MNRAFPLLARRHHAGSSPADRPARGAGHVVVGLRRRPDRRQLVRGRPACPRRPNRTSTRVPAGPTLNPSGHDNKPTMSFHSKVEELKKGDKKIGVGTADVPDARGHSRCAADGAASARPRAAGDRNSGSRGALHDTQPHSKDRPMLLRRLAEDYVELENAAFTREDAGRGHARRAQAKAIHAGGQAAVDRQLPREDDDESVAQSGDQILHDARRPTIRASRRPRSRRTHRPLTRSSTRSIIISRTSTSRRATRRTRVASTSISSRRPRTRSTFSNAYLAFGELFFNEALSDPTKWEPAKQAYQKVISKPPPENKVYGYAWYKLAYVFWNHGRPAARSRRVQEDDRLRVRSSQLPNAKKLAESGPQGRDPRLRARG